MKIPPVKQPTSFRLSPKALRLLDAMAKGFAVSKTSVIEMALRMFAKRQGYDK